VEARHESAGAVFGLVEREGRPCGGVVDTATSFRSALVVGHVETNHKCARKLLQETEKQDD